MKLIPLSKGMFAKVSDCDFERVSQHKWHACADHRRCYAKSWIRDHGQKKHVLLHRFILDAAAGSIIDHINGDQLDCQRDNLRTATTSQNTANQPPRAKSGFKGVSLNKCGRYVAQIWRSDRGTTYLGSFASAEEAAQAHDRAAVLLYGEYAWGNFNRQ